MHKVDSQAIVISNESVNDEYKHMVISVSETAAMVVPGQFFNILCPTSDKNRPFLRRPMSTYFADANKKQVEFLYKIVGAGTKGLADAKADDTIAVLGPLGRGFTLTDSDNHIVVLGRGVGLATLAPLAEYAAEKGIKVTAILSAKDQSRLMSQSRFIDAGAEIIALTDSDNSSAIDNVEQVIKQIHQQHPISAFFTCGSVRLAKLLQKLSYELAIRGEVALEQNMACGIGMCYACVIPIRVDGESAPKSKKVCEDGPVFNIRDVVYE